MKKYIAAAAALAACIALCACGRTTSESSVSSVAETSIAAETSAAETASAADGWNGTFVGADGNMTLSISAVGNSADIKISTATGNEISLKADVSGSAASADYEGANIAFALSGDGKQINVVSIFDDVSGTYEKTESGANNLFGSSENDVPAEDNGWYGTYYCADNGEYLVIAVDKLDNDGMEFNFSGEENYYTNISEQGDTENNLFISADKDISLGRMSAGDITVLSIGKPALSGTYKPADPSAAGETPQISINIAPQETTAKPAATTTQPAVTTAKPAATTPKPAAAPVNNAWIGSYYCEAKKEYLVISAGTNGMDFSFTGGTTYFTNRSEQGETENLLYLAGKKDVSLGRMSTGTISVLSVDNPGIAGMYKPVDPSAVPSSAKPAATTTAKPAATTTKAAATGKVDVLNKIGSYYCSANNCTFTITADEYADLGCSFSMSDGDKKFYSTSNAQYESDNSVSLSIRGDVIVVFNADGSISVTDNGSKTGGIYTGTYKPQ